MASPSEGLSGSEPRRGSRNVRRAIDQWRSGLPAHSRHGRSNGLLLGVPREADYSGQFAMDQDADTLTFTKGDDGSDEGDLTIRFVAQTID